MFMYALESGTTPRTALSGGFRIAGNSASVTRSFDASGRGRVHTAG